MTVTDEDVEAVADVIDPHIRGIIADYCAKKGYTAAETAEEFAKSGRWQQAKEKARECLQAYASRKSPPEPGWNEAVEASAKAIAEWGAARKAGREVWAAGRLEAVVRSLKKPEVTQP